LVNYLSTVAFYGAENNFFFKFSKVLEPVIKNVYRMLKDIVLRDDDDRIVTYHATQALEKLAEIVKEYLNPKRQTGKTIFQLRLP